MRRFMIAANLPDDLEMVLADRSLGVSAAAQQHHQSLRHFTRPSSQFVAPALRAHVPGGCDQLRGLASLATDQLDAAAASSTTSLREQLRKAQQLLQEINQAHEALAEQLSNTKYQIRKMDAGTTDDFHKGLADRIGYYPVFCAVCVPVHGCA